MVPIFSTGNVPDAPGCRLPFGFGFLVFCALLVLTLVANINWLALLEGGVPPQAPPQGQVNVVPSISERDFDSGTTHASVSGDWSFSSDLAINDVASYVDSDGLAWISFGAYGDPTEVLISLNEPENSLTVADGATSATGIDDECVFTVTVTSTLVSGRVTCSSLEVLRGGEPAGTVSIDLQFSAGSPPAGSEPDDGVDG